MDYQRAAAERGPGAGSPLGTSEHRAVRARGRPIYLECRAFVPQRSLTCRCLLALPLRLSASDACMGCLRVIVRSVCPALDARRCSTMVQTQVSPGRSAAGWARGAAVPLCEQVMRAALGLRPLLS